MACIQCLGKEGPMWWLELYERWIRVFSEAIPWAVRRGSWMDILHVAALSVCSVGPLAGLFLLR